jgi:hypothetical protein
MPANLFVGVVTIELTAHTRVTAANKDLAYRKARQQVVENSIEMLDVTHCEEI